MKVPQITRPLALTICGLVILGTGCATPHSQHSAVRAIALPALPALPDSHPELSDYYKITYLAGKDVETVTTKSFDQAGDWLVMETFSTTALGVHRDQFPTPFWLRASEVLSIQRAMLKTAPGTPATYRGEPSVRIAPPQP
jgi:hypothetical protein